MLFFIIRCHTYFYCKNKNSIIISCNLQNAKEKSYTCCYLTYAI